MKNIGVVVDNEFYSDVRVVNECKILASQGFNIHVLCFDFGTSKPINLDQKIIVHPIKFNRKIKNILYAFNNSFELYTLFWQKQIKRFIKTQNIDALHVHDLFMSKAAHYATKNKAINFNVDLHENYPAAIQDYKWMYKNPQQLLIQPKKWNSLEGKYLKYPENIIVLSESFRDDLLSKFPFLNKNQFVIYPNIPDINEFNNYSINENILDKQDSFILFYFGVISSRRGVYTCTEAVKILKAEIPNIKLLFIGPVDKAEQEEFDLAITENEIKDHIIHYPWQDISTLPSFIKISDICLSPILKNDQHESGIANKVFQYMLFERPLIVSDCKPQKRLVEEEHCGLAFESDNANDLSEKILSLYNDSELRILMGKNGKKAILEKYNTEITGKNLVNLYQ